MAGAPLVHTGARTTSHEVRRARSPAIVRARSSPPEHGWPRGAPIETSKHRNIGTSEHRNATHTQQKTNRNNMSASEGSEGTLGEERPGVAKVRAMLGKKLRVRVTDGRVFYGYLNCFDKRGNLILVNATECRLAAGCVRGLPDTRGGAEDARRCQLFSKHKLFF